MDLWILFSSAFISSTLFPGGSEVLLVYMLEENVHSKEALVITATLGNTLGGMTTWFIGWLLAVKWPVFQLTKPSHYKALDRLQHYGSPALLFSWMPFIGDPLCLVAGWLRMNVLLSLGFILVGKAARYIILVYWFSA